MLEAILLQPFSLEEHILFSGIHSFYLGAVPFSWSHFVIHFSGTHSCENNRVKVGTFSVTHSSKWKSFFLMEGSCSWECRKPFTIIAKSSLYVWLGSECPFGLYLIFLVSLRLTRVETLESFSQNFKRRFYFLFYFFIFSKRCRGQPYCKVKLGGRSLKFSKN